MHMAEQMCDSICMIFRGNKVLDGKLGEVKSQYGEPRLRVAMTGGQELPNDLPGVTEMIPVNPYTDLVLEPGASKQAILRRLVDMGEVAHFENRLPSLHDIFVRIAQPTDSAAVV
jgi:ABC-2 type transport system ATP-binding protein